MDIPDPAGSVFRAVWGGFVSVNAGDTSVTIPLKFAPGPYNIYVIPNWNAGQPYETSHLGAGFTVVFPYECPAGGGQVRWLVFTF